MRQGLHSHNQLPALYRFHQTKQPALLCRLDQLQCVIPKRWLPIQRPLQGLPANKLYRLNYVPRFGIPFRMAHSCCNLYGFRDRWTKCFHHLATSANLILKQHLPYEFRLIHTALQEYREESEVDFQDLQQRPLFPSWRR